MFTLSSYLLETFFSFEKYFGGHPYYGTICLLNLAWSQWRVVTFALLFIFINTAAK